MKEQILINANSSKEEIADFFVKKFDIKEEVKNNLIKEDISGDILLDLDKNDFKKLGMGLGSLKKTLLFLKENKEIFEINTINKNLKLTDKSDCVKVADFFKKSLNYSGNLNKLDGKGLLKINSEEIEKLGLNMGQKKKIIKYIDYFKTLKEENPEEKEIIITKESTKEEVAKFLKDKFNLSKEVIESLDLDGEIFLLLEDNDIDDVDELNEEEKLKIKNYLNELKSKNEENKKPEKEIIITKESSKEDVSNFLKNKFNFSEKIIDALDLDGESLFFLEENDINDMDELNKEEKDLIKNYLKTVKLENNYMIEKEKNIKENILEPENVQEVEESLNNNNLVKLKRILECIIYFIEAFSKIKEIRMTDFINNLKSTYKLLESGNINDKEILKSINMVLKNNCDIIKETDLIYFYDLFYGKEEVILFIKKIKESEFDIKEFYELIDETELKTSDIDDFIYVYNFFKNLMENQEIKTDEKLFFIFRNHFDDNKDIRKFYGCLYTYPKIISLFRDYYENVDITIQRIDGILKESIIVIHEDKEVDKFIYYIRYRNHHSEMSEIDAESIEYLRNNVSILKENNKGKKSKKFSNIIENINALTNIINILYKSGYPSSHELNLKINNSQVFEEKNNERKDLQKLIEYYSKINEKFQREQQIGYDKYPLLRLFYGKQLKKLFGAITNKKINISHLVNPFAMDKIKNFNVDYVYDIENNVFQNINQYLDQLFKINRISLDDIYKYNKVKEQIDLEPGLYRKVKSYSYNINIFLNVYLNMTGNLPIINTMLICNEETSNEKIYAFLFRALFCDKPILFLITHLERLQLEAMEYFTKTLKILYKKRNYNINSYILFFYEKNNNDISKAIESIIPYNHILNDSFIFPRKEKIKEFQNIEVYTSKFGGFGKTTEIKYQIKSLGGNYYYLPISGTISRKDIINNLEDLKLDLNKGKLAFLHIDLFGANNEDLMNEILFKLIILRYLDSRETIFYLGNDIRLIIELQNGFFELDKKYKILNLFKRIHIDKLGPLRLEENIKLINDSPILIVAEVLSLYDNDRIELKNIDLDASAKKKAEECEIIINKYFKNEFPNYYNKMNFIKILSFLFKRFTNNVYLNYKYTEYECNQKKVKIFRKSLLKNFIDFANNLTQFSSKILSDQQRNMQNYFSIKSDEMIIEELIINSLDEEEDRILLNIIKSNLIIFNKDGMSLSIISNNKKNDLEYKILKSLWNYQNFRSNNDRDLVDYKNLTHEDFLKQIKILFSLDRISIEEMEQLCITLGNFIFVPDNFIKIAIILMKIQAKIPVILMGETGTGKTKLIEMIDVLFNKRRVFELRIFRLQIHSGTNDESIVKFIESINREVERSNQSDELTLILFDKINNCNSLGLIQEITCNHTYLGRKINDNFIFLGTCNPYKILTKKMRENANSSNGLMYSVNPLPHSLFNFVINLDPLKKQNEKDYIKNMIISLLYKEEKNGGIKGLDKNDKTKFINDFIDSVIICHDFIREKYDSSLISLRDINRLGILYEYYLKYFDKIKSTFQKLKSSLNIALYLCYYLRINIKEYREELSNSLKPFFNNFLQLPEREENLLTKEFIAEEGIALTKALKENLFASFFCLENNIPLIIIGNPGMGKYLGLKILDYSLRGEYSESDLFKNKGKLYRYYYQGSETNTIEGLKHIFWKAYESKNNEGKDNKILVYFNKMHLAESASTNPLKILPYLLEGKEKVAFIGTLERRLSEDIMNNALNLSLIDYDMQDLENIAFSIAKSFDYELSNKYQYFFGALTKTYYEYIKFNQNLSRENKYIHGNRDFYALIKIAIRELIEKKNKLNKNEDKILTETGILSFNINFGGLENSANVIKKIFKNIYMYKFDEEININKTFSILDAIKKNILYSNNRYLLLISETNDEINSVKYILDLIGKKYIELVGSKFDDLKTEVYQRNIFNKVKDLLETEKVLILRDLEIIYPYLYNLFAQNFVIMGEKLFITLNKIASEVNKNFHCIVIINKNQLENLKFSPSFLNSLEKHLTNFRFLLNEKDIEIADKISSYLENIACYFNQENSNNSSFEKILINCAQNNIEVLLFRLKNIIANKFIENNLYNDEYEKMIIKNIVKKIVPVFCENIITSLKNNKNNIDIKFKKINDIFIEAYNECHCINFEQFFKNLNSKKNIIYTFSKIEEDVFDGKKELKNNFGTFNISNAIMNYIHSIKEENELISILKSLIKEENKSMLILKFSENEIDKINSVEYVIKDFQKINTKLSEKIIIFIIYIDNLLERRKMEGALPDLISFGNFDYYQIFIDNLQ